MINIKTPEQIEGIKTACKVVAAVHSKVREEIKPGMSTYQVDNIVRLTLQKHDAISAFYKYSQAGKRKFPGYSCISVNEEVVHGIPSHTCILKEGDVITIDVGAILNKYIGDAAFTMIIGKGTPENEKLVEITKYALDTAIAKSAPGVWLYDISETIHDICKANSYGLVRNYYGHGVGLKLHEDPQIPNFRPEPGKGVDIQLKPGMIITYEPMFVLGSGETMELADGWSVITKDRSMAAHWEHTILITDTGAEALTI